jgi:hypothetical protein
MLELEPHAKAPSGVSADVYVFSGPSCKKDGLIVGDLHEGSMVRSTQ